MQSKAFMVATTDLVLPPSFDIFMKNVATKTSQTISNLRIIGYIDTTKFGILLQTDIDKIANWAEKLVARNPLGNMASCIVLERSRVAHALPRLNLTFVRNMHRRPAAPSGVGQRGGVASCRREAQYHCHWNVPHCALKQL